MKKIMPVWMVFAFIMTLITMPLAAQTDLGVFAPFVSRLSAVPENNRIRLTWVDSPDIKGQIFIFRSNLPFIGPDPVLGDAVASIPYGTQVYVDEIIRGGTYYYYAIASDETGRRFNFPIISTNTISVISDFIYVPQIVQEGQIEPAREQLTILADDRADFEILPYTPLLGPIVLIPRVFVTDLEPIQRTYDDHALAMLVRHSFGLRDWERAKLELILFLSVPRSHETRARARFYLGQCMYFLHEPQEGLFEFLTIQDRFPEETAIWIQAAYNMMNYSLLVY
ncbi:MAG: hypothetical protein FWG77_10495 [Treponema sp.]|nr:hypothetical protein [Treponema sp.]